MRKTVAKELRRMASSLARTNNKYVYRALKRAYKNGDRDYKKRNFGFYGA